MSIFGYFKLEKLACRLWKFSMCFLSSFIATLLSNIPSSKSTSSFRFLVLFYCIIFIWAALFQAFLCDFVSLVCLMQLCVLSSLLHFRSWDWLGWNLKVSFLGNEFEFFNLVLLVCFLRRTCHWCCVGNWKYSRRWNIFFFLRLKIFQTQISSLAWVFLQLWVTFVLHS